MDPAIQKQCIILALLLAFSFTAGASGPSVNNAILVFDNKQQTTSSGAVDISSTPYNLFAFDSLTGSGSSSNLNTPHFPTNALTYSLTDSQWEYTSGAFATSASVILTKPDADEDIIKAYTPHASCYIRKPLNIEEFVKVVKRIKDFWFTIVSLPPKLDVRTS